MPQSTTNTSAAQMAKLKVQMADLASLDLSSVHRAQEKVQQLLLSAGAGERMARLAKSDLLESSLLRAMVVIQSSNQYLTHERAAHRVTFLALHLEIAILNWLNERVASRREAFSLLLCEKTLVNE